MKITQSLFVLFILGQICSCQEIKEQKYSLDIEVEDPDGNPVSGVRAITGKLVPMGNGTQPLPLAKPITIESPPSDHRGRILLEYESLPEPDGRASVYGAGHYTSIYTFGWNSLKGGSGMTRSAKVSAILKPVKNPIPLVYSPCSGIILKEKGVEYSFDLALGEPLPPYGKGLIPDVTIRLEEIKTANGTKDETVTGYKSVIRFGNPNDGMIEFPSQPRDGAVGSAFMSDYLAPEHGYVSTLERWIGAGAGRTEEGWKYIHSLKRMGYYFRIRSKTDVEGKIVSAHYGKIYGPVELTCSAEPGRPAEAAPGKVGLSFSEVYFNPTPNDRNVECDTKKNLSEKRDSYGKPFPIARP